MNQFKTFLSRYPLETFEKGQVILLGGDRPRGIYFIESGLVKTYAISSTGEEQLISIDGRDAHIPIGYATGIIEVSEYHYDAYNRCRIRVVPREDYNRHIRMNIDSLYIQHVRMTIMLLSFLERIQALEQHQAGNKVARTLLYISNQFGAVPRKRSASTHLKITQQEIANLLGLTRETTGAELKKLELKKLISYSRKNYTLFVQKIRDYINGDSN